MGSLFGGGKDDGGAAQVARINAEEAEKSRVAEQTRWQAEKDRITKDQAAAEAARVADAKKAQDALDAARTEQSNVSKANAVTGAPGFDNGALQKQLILSAANNAGGSGLPGFQNLQKKPQAAPGATPNGQSNSLVSQSGFNALQVGGRRYI